MHVNSEVHLTSANVDGFTVYPARARRSERHTRSAHGARAVQTVHQLNI